MGDAVSSKGRPYLVLSVDDDKDIRDLVRMVLEPGGYEVVGVGSAEDALSVVVERQPDLILVDVMMPGMDGYEFCETVQERGLAEYTPVIFMSALGDEQDRTRAFACGAVDYLTKPINQLELREKVDICLSTKDNWSDLKESTRAFTERIVPADFLGFKDALAEEYGEDRAKARSIEGMRPNDVYAVANSIGLAPDVMAMRMAAYLHLEYMPFVDVSSTAMGVLPAAFCKRNIVAPVTRGGCMTYVVSNPFNWELLDLLENKSQSELCLAVADPDSILAVFRQSPAEVDAAQASSPAGSVELHELSSEDDVGVLNAADIEARPVVFIANSIIMQAINERASDIHLEPKEDHYDVRFRIDGDMRDILTLKRRTGTMLISRYKALGGMDIAEHRRPQDGTVDATVEDRKLKLRLATTSGPYGESIVIRILETSVAAVTLDDLGMTSKQAGALYGYAARTHGMIVIVGPTGSGKTTTVYSVLTSIDTERRSLMSVEDPVEYIIARANQQQVNDKAGVTFENLLKSSVRQDPDILFMGEIRDAFSAKTAVDFASTGHITISTLHTSTSTTAIFRLERLGVERSMMADSILCIVAQRLVKKLCPHCRRIEPITEDERRMLEPYADDIPETVAHPVGCPKCYGGYFGREAVSEVLEFDNDLGEWIRTGVAIAEIRQRLRDRGDYLLPDHAVQKVREHVMAVKDVHARVLIEEESSKPEKGAARKSAAPAKRAVEDEGLIGSAQAADTGGEELIGEAVRAGRHLLIVDDDESTRELLGKALSDGGFTVSYASDGEAALARLRGETFDLCLADYNMPEMDGLTLLKMVNESEIGIPIVLLTGTPGFDTEAAALRAGAADYVRKPIRKDVLALRVERALALAIPAEQPAEPQPASPVMSVFADEEGPASAASARKPKAKSTAKPKAASKPKTTAKARSTAKPKAAAAPEVAAKSKTAAKATAKPRPKAEPKPKKTPKRGS